VVAAPATENHAAVDPQPMLVDWYDRRRLCGYLGMVRPIDFGPAPLLSGL